jgi:hypothetical protein
MWNIISLFIYSSFINLLFNLYLFIYLIIFTGLLQEWLGNFFKESKLNPMLTFLQRN